MRPSEGRHSNLLERTGGTIRIEIILTFLRFYDFIPLILTKCDYFLNSVSYRKRAAISKISTLSLPPMSSLLAALGDLLPSSTLHPAAAAAVIVLTNTPPAPPPASWDKAVRAVAPHLTEAERGIWVTALMELLPKAGMTAPRCVAAFLGQCAVESAGFRELQEDLHYSAERLCQVWPHRFPSTEAAEACALQPEILANRVYANRMGNGDEASGDGWQFRGRGLIQITGRTAYQHFAHAAGQTVDQAVEYATTPAGAVHSAVWFWTANQLNALAIIWSIDRLTQKINGGQSGAAERTRLCEAALLAIGP